MSTSPSSAARSNLGVRASRSGLRFYRHGATAHRGCRIIESISLVAAETSFYRCITHRSGACGRDARHARLRL